MKTTDRILAITLLVLLSCGVISAQDIVRLERAHAHNDYNHEHPLFDALDNGFTSVEADIYLVDGELYVAHNFEDIKKDRTLKALYLDPLKNILEDRSSKYYSLFPIKLMIDIKQDGLEAYKVLEKQLYEYEKYITAYNGNESTPRMIDVIISGDRPIEYMRSQTKRLASIDGRSENIEDSEFLFPLISDDIYDIVGDVKDEDSIKVILTNLADKVHKNHKILRIWGAPDTEESWKTQNEAGLDLIGTDALPELKAYFLSLPNKD